jgi:hypothetical protein
VRHAESGNPRTRLLTAREAARLMGVPEHLPLPDHYNRAYKAMGDGVAVPVVRYLSEHLLTPLAERVEPRPSAPPAEGDLARQERLAVRRQAAREQAIAWAESVRPR